MSALNLNDFTQASIRVHCSQWLAEIATLFLTCNIVCNEYESLARSTCYFGSVTYCADAIRCHNVGKFRLINILLL